MILNRYRMRVRRLVARSGTRTRVDDCAKHNIEFLAFAFGDYNTSIASTV
jgi:hypothetical protein